MAFSFILGLCAGSFANVLIYRLPRGLDFIRGFSACPACGRRVRGRDLIPVLSFIALRGKCRGCGARISVQYPLAELSGGILGALAAARFGFNIEGLLYGVFFITLLVIAWIDARHMIIPDGLVIALAVVAAPLVLFYGRGTPWLMRLAGLFILSLPMFLMNLLIKDAFGGGDIKLMAVCGFALGLWPALAAGFIGVTAAGARALAYILSGKPYKGRRIPFGPYLCAGVLIAALWGERIVRWYLSLI